MKLAQSLVFTFTKNERGNYSRTDGPGHFTKVPEELFIEVIRHPETIAAERLIRGHERRGKTYVFQTGIRPLSSNIYYGDHYERKPNGEKINSFIIFEFDSGGEKLTLHFFNAFKLFPRSRGKFVTTYLQSLKK